ncbi:hypothetical protein BOTBODRAFT_35805 [Botryobasidium botryosum FD-172 SS1]|uniref:Uncharacterized protein n=1 Tax=Botryobasidium botryosum (strain FD-172 SS1) TaxID=930990 RepID=A0A067M852_BOTB1|nr:hypothetical protein BOTBODRAFT_35805 [Botryobasidium botryosum FD-172 SS1]
MPGIARPPSSTYPRAAPNLITRPPKNNQRAQAKQSGSPRTPQLGASATAIDWRARTLLTKPLRSGPGTVPSRPAYESSVESGEAPMRGYPVAPVAPPSFQLAESRYYLGFRV